MVIEQAPHPVGGLDRISRTMAHQMAEDAARGTIRLPQPPPVVEEVPMRASSPMRSETTRVVTRTDAPPDPVQQALADLKTFTDGQGYVNQVQADTNKGQEKINNYVVERLGQIQADVTTLKAHPSGSTWPDLISRWTSRTWLLPFVSGVAAVATLVGTVFGSLDPHITAGSGMVAALFGGLFIILEKKNDGAVRVAQAIQTPAPAEVVDRAARDAL